MVHQLIEFYWLEKCLQYCLKCNILHCISKYACLFTDCIASIILHSTCYFVHLFYNHTVILVICMSKYSNPDLGIEKLKWYQKTFFIYNFSQLLCYSRETAPPLKTCYLDAFVSCCCLGFGLLCFLCFEALCSVLNSRLIDKRLHSAHVYPLLQCNDHPSLLTGQG